MQKTLPTNGAFFLCFFRVFSIFLVAEFLFSLIFRLGEKDDGDHEGDYSGGEKVDAKLADKVCYEGLTCLGMPYEGDAIICYEMEEEIVDNEYYRRGNK